MQSLYRVLVFVVYSVAVLGTVNADESKPKVLITNPNVPRIAFELLSNCCEIISTQNNTREQIISNVNGVHAILLRSKTKIDSEVLDAAGPQLKIIGSMSAGYDHIDLEEIKKRGIKLSNTPNVTSEAVADSAVLLGLAAARRLHEGRLLIDSGNWNPNVPVLGQDIRGSTVGIFGLGGIGLEILRRLKVFGVKEFLYSGHREKPEGKRLGAKFIPLSDTDTLIKQSDFIFIAVPLTPKTEKMCNEDFFSKMKKTAIFVNISRGPVVDQKALYKALKDGQIFAAGLDVMTPEPIPPTDELLTLPNLVLTPHWGSATVKTRHAMAELAAQNILKALNGEPMLTPVV